jgi:hypothetical protein
MKDGADARLGRDEMETRQDVAHGGGCGGSITGPQRQQEGYVNFFVKCLILNDSESRLLIKTRLSSTYSKKSSRYDSPA